ncbi:MAG: Mur ligase family protein [Patescibacteria group bacterium]|nr:Mur ligase family protein [Patescibacteria group bacterium]
MSIILIILILFFIKLLRDSLSFIWLWQVKEYRIDRMISSLKEDKNILQNNLFYISAIIIFVFLYINQIAQKLSFRAVGEKSDNIVDFLDFSLHLASFEMTKIQFILYIVLAFFLITFLQIFKEIKKRSFLRPRPTLKVILIFLLLIAVYLLIAFCWISFFSLINKTRIPVESIVSGIELMLFIYLVNPIVISSIILTINPFFNFQKKRLIKKSTIKMQGLKKIKVIGIAGSYGKTSTKEFLYAILSQKYKVVKTEGNNNTNIGVAYTVLNKVSDEYDYFICEMGAYKIGEIKQICEIVKPEIGILTGINEQHIDLFGSIKNTTKAKFELIEALPENGLAIINSKIKNQEIKIINKKYFSLNNIENIKVYQDYIEFDYLTVSNCHCEEERQSNFETMREKLNSEIASSSYGATHNDSDIIKFKINLLGKHYIENVLSVIMTAEYLGMNLNEIKSAVEEIKPTKFMMQKLDGLNNSVFINDSYSANSDGVLAALDYLEEAYQDYKKMIVFPGIIELGKESDKVHEKLFERIGEVCDVAYIMGNKKQKSRNKNDCKFVLEKDFGKVAEMVKNNLNKNTVVLFESRGAGVVMGKTI